MGVLAEPKVDCHTHVFDPVRYPYRPDTPYRPSGQEIGTAAQLRAVLAAYGMRNALVVGPNSGYGVDSSCLVDALRGGAGLLKGVAVVENDTSREQLEELGSVGVVGVTFNAASLGVEYYHGTERLLSDLADLDMFVDVQVEGDQLVSMRPLLERSDARILVDHCGRPTPAAGVDQPGFQALLQMAENGRTAVKLSGLAKCSRAAYPHEDAWPYVHALTDAFGCDALLWGSDWPFLRATERTDYGPLLDLAARLLPDATDRRKVLWETPRRLFGFGD